MCPSVFVFLETFPLTPNGKLDRKALPAPSSDRLDLGTAYMPPCTELESLLAGIWQQILGIDKVGVRDNFFELGGHSLLATQLISRVREVCHVDMPLRALFSGPTVELLAAEIDGLLRSGPGLSSPPIVRVDRSEPLRVSFAQHRLWFLDQLEPGGVSYNMPSALRLIGDLDLLALEHTVAEVIRRHEVLRTHFELVDNHPVQVIEEPGRITLSLSDLTDMPAAEREGFALRLSSEEASSPFDLSRGPLIRVRLLRLSSEDHVLLFTLHHIVCDGWSVGVLVREVSALYAAYASGEVSPLPELSIQYGDYAVWQRSWLEGDVLETQLSYWRNQLSDLPTLELPTDYPRPSVQSYRGSSASLRIPAGLTQG
jgi:hypothetical protein